MKRQMLELQRVNRELLLSIHQSSCGIDSTTRVPADPICHPRDTPPLLAPTNRQIGALVQAFHLCFKLRGSDVAELSNLLCLSSEPNQGPKQATAADRRSDKLAFQARVFSINFWEDLAKYKAIFWAAYSYLVGDVHGNRLPYSDLTKANGSERPTMPYTNSERVAQAPADDMVPFCGKPLDYDIAPPPLPVLGQESLRALSSLSTDTSRHSGVSPSIPNQCKQWGVRAASPTHSAPKRTVAWSKNRSGTTATAAIYKMRTGSRRPGTAPKPGLAKPRSCTTPSLPVEDDDDGEGDGEEDEDTEEEDYEEEEEDGGESDSDPESQLREVAAIKARPSAASTQVRMEKRLRREAANALAAQEDARIERAHMLLKPGGSGHQMLMGIYGDSMVNASVQASIDFQAMVQQNTNDAGEEGRVHQERGYC